MCFCYVPNAFTPNNDGLNDEFLVKGTFIQTYRMKIYDRWGTKIFESNDQYKGWDGKFKGKLCPLGEYLFILSVNGSQNQSKMVSGTVLLLK